MNQVPSTEKSEMQILALSDSISQAGQFVLILEEPNSKIRLPIIIGTLEAQSIAIALEKMVPARPLTYDLFKNTVEALDVQLKEVYIHTEIDLIFYAQIEWIKPDKTTFVVDARPSDAITLAIYLNAPVYCAKTILEAGGYTQDNFWGKHNQGSFADYSTPELEELLNKVLLKEDYESASRIRDLIEKRKKKE